MFKIRDKERTDKKIPDFETESRITEETRSFFVSAKKYIVKSFELYTGIIKKTFDKMSDMLSEELGTEGADYKKRTKIFLLSLLLVVLGFLISSTEFSQGAYPLSLSIVASAGSRVKRKNEFTPRLVMGLSFFSVVLSTLRMGADGLLYFTVIFTVFILRSVVTSGKFDEGAVYRTMTALFSAVILSVCSCIIESFSLGSIFTGITISVTAPLFAYMFSGFFVSLGDPLFESGMKMRVEVGLAAMFFALVLALSKLSIFGFSLAATISFAITCLVAKTLGSMHGGVFGMLGGIAAGGGLFASAFGVVGVVTSVFFAVSDILALSVAVLISSAVAIYVGGFTGFITILPEVLFGCIVLYPILKAFPVVEERISLVSHKIRTSESHERERVERELTRMSGTFATLSEVFFAVTDTLRTPTLEDVTRTVEKAYNKVCATCSMSGMCWSKHYTDSNDVKNGIAERIIESGRAERDDFPDHFTERCIKLDSIIEQINKKYAGLCYVANDVSHANLIAGEYHTVSKLLQSTAKGFHDAESENMELAGKAFRAMRGLAIPFGRIEAWGRRKSVIDVFGVQPERIERSSAEILASFETECSMLFEEPEFIKLETTSALRMKRRAPISLECAKKSMSKKGEKVNGDSIAFFEKDNGYFYALICDGMGSGRSAALTSRLATVFLEKLLTCTDDKKVTLEMLNSLLMAKKDECFTTLDLVEIDFFDMKASFMKAGASPSFVVREDNVYKVNSATAPAGIISKLTAEETRISVKGGDMIVMLSDGIIDSTDIAPEDNPWLVELIDANRSKSSADLCDTILSEALTRFGASDDMSVVVIEVHK